jgi:hypothetical protein
MFQLRSAYDDLVTPEPTMNPPEWDIITSPCLCSIWVGYRMDVAENGEQLPSRQLDVIKVDDPVVLALLREAYITSNYQAGKGTLRSLRAGVRWNFASDNRGPAGPWAPTTFLTMSNEKSCMPSPRIKAI